MAKREKLGDYRVAYEAKQKSDEDADKQFSQSAEKINESLKSKAEPHPQLTDKVQERTLASHSIPLMEEKE